MSFNHDPIKQAQKVIFTRKIQNQNCIKNASGFDNEIRSANYPKCSHQKSWFIK